MHQQGNKTLLWDHAHLQPAFFLYPLYGWDRSGFAFTTDELDTLARREHERWAAERQRDGWRHGPERDDARKLNPLLVGWDELPDASKEFNRDAARQLPALLARAGFELVRLSGR